MLLNFLRSCNTCSSCGLSYDDDAFMEAPTPAYGPIFLHVKVQVQPLLLRLARLRMASLRSVFNQKVLMATRRFALATTTGRPKGVYPNALEQCSDFHNHFLAS
ncbi:hypothetical protein VNO78_02603 [Psophocarpus tetragonolobus]|uniref:Uncharacterized protein n=1 Tax=Psophocarpus tetragonolobus TaxID=3891 RepID=A0AAN9SZ47_PSOTE